MEIGVRTQPCTKMRETVGVYVCVCTEGEEKRTDDKVKTIKLIGYRTVLSPTGDSEDSTTRLGRPDQTEEIRVQCLPTRISQRYVIWLGL